ncbi:hypothetical protein LOAG_08187 [Loa loa]|uniref:Uncharacterized protein n=1 Tax=Loa loa TaxID=7209 RepID=A0A1S0TUG3_LOALO|nr:hypothetical protein LOAG_08187 [Loa loa]EFO20301.2 hypothetical protein LOAG_08187 [Loa loa]
MKEFNFEVGYKQNAGRVNTIECPKSESSKVPSSGKSEGSQKGELKISRKTPETDSHATSKQEESSNKGDQIIRKT